MPSSLVQDALRKRLCVVPVPTSPEPRSRRDEELGLVILELSLRLNHVVRLAERISLSRVHHLQRTVGLDIDLGRLTRRQRDAARAGNQDPHSDRNGLWVPVSRHEGQDLALVRDAAGQVLPCMTGHAVRRITAAAMVQLFRMLIAANPDSVGTDTVLNALRRRKHRSRWLFEAAIRSLVDDGLRAGEDQAYVDNPTRATPTAGGGSDQDIRDWVTDEVLPKIVETEADFVELLGLAVSAHPVVVMVPDGPRNLHLSFTSPTVSAKRAPSRLPSKRALLGAISPRREFDFEYHTEIPRAVASYHFSVDVDPQVTVTRLMLSTSVDETAVEALAQDMRALADTSNQLHPAVRAVVMRGIASRLAHVVARRITEENRYHNTAASGGQRGGGKGGSGRTGAVTELVNSLEHWKRSEAAAPNNAGGRRSGFTDKRLRRTARTLTRFKLGRDIVGDDDPRENGAHAYWHRPERFLGPRSTDPLTVRAYVCLSDGPPSLGGSVTLMTGVLGVMVIALATYLTHGLSWLTLAPTRTIADLAPAAQGALVTILLLVPGVLLSRLDIPAATSALGNIRLLARIIAYGAVTATTALAAVIAAAGPTRPPLIGPFQAVTLILALLTAYGVLALITSRRRRSLVPYAARKIAPRWSHDRVWQVRSSFDRKPDAKFTVGRAER